MTQMLMSGSADPPHLRNLDVPLDFLQQGVPQKVDDGVQDGADDVRVPGGSPFTWVGGG